MAFTARDARYAGLSTGLLVLFVGAYVLATLPDGARAAAPDFELPTVDGGTTRIVATDGRVTVVEFFSTKCEPCERVQASMQELRAERGDGIRFLSVGVDPTDGFDELVAYGQQKALPWPMAMGDAAVLEAFGIQVFAHVVVIDADGGIVRVLTGTPDVEALRAAVGAA